MTSTKNKTLDAVEMSRDLRQRTGHLLAGMSREERLALLNAHLSDATAQPAKRMLVEIAQQK